MINSVKMNAFDILGAGEYIQNGLLLAHCDWLNKVIEEKCIDGNPFIKHASLTDDDIRAYLLDSKAPPTEIKDQFKWKLLSVESYNISNEVAFPLFRVKDGINALHSKHLSNDGSFSEVLQYIDDENFLGLWKNTFEKYENCFKVRNDKNASSAIQVSDPTKNFTYERSLIEVIARIYRCPMIDLRSTTHATVTKKELEDYSNEQHFEQPNHVVPMIAAFICDNQIILLRPFQEFNIKDVLKFSPAFLNDNQCQLKQLFVVYQILKAITELHGLGVTLGDIQLTDIKIDQNYLVKLNPDLKSSLVFSQLPFNENEDVGNQESRPVETKTYERMSNTVAELITSLQTIREKTKEDDESITQNFLSSILKMWISGSISNFDYLMLLNYLADRTFDNPNYYPVIPWVRDFSSENGGWRDFSKSKYRLNKGDQQLDITYDGQKSVLGQKAKSHEEDEFMLNQHRILETPPHHVSDVLSEITYYVYKARITSKTVLCKYVRNRWVPAEYPSSMQRLQAWTPDECIPDFFTNSSIFRSIHDDLHDLELPEWCNNNATEFIKYHRASLESEYVSDRLHQWVDLTFGYKLSGSSAIRAKNVCLHLVERSEDLKKQGVMQLFSHPHPIRQTGYSPYWDSNAAKLLSNMLVQKIYSEMEAHEYNLEKSLDHIEKNVNEFKRPSTSDTTSASKTRWSSDCEGNKNSICLPKDCDMSIAINELDNLNSFLLKNGETPNFNTKVLKNDGKHTPKISKSITRNQKDMKLVGCLILEIYMPQKFMGLGSKAGIHARISRCEKIVKNEHHNIPLIIRAVVKKLIAIPGNELNRADNDFSYYSISAEGFPPLCAQYFMHPITSELPFPVSFCTFTKILRLLDEIKFTQDFKTDPNTWSSEVNSTVAEVQVKMVAAELCPIIDEISEHQLRLILPVVKSLFQDQSTAILAVWYLFEPISKALGPSQTSKQLLEYVLNIYEQSAQTPKHLKLYHRTFLLNLIVRVGTKTFLKYFITYIIEAVGGYKDFDDGISKEGLVRSWNTTGLSNTSSTTASPERVVGSASSTPILAPKGIKNQLPSDSAITNTKLDDQKTPGEEFNEGEIFSFDNAINKDVLPPQDQESNRTCLGSDRNLISPQPIVVPSACENYGESRETEDNQELISDRNKDGNTSDIALESVIWLSHRLGPVLSSKFLSRNLLKMLNLCYIGPNGFKATTNKFSNQKIRISRTKIEGDILAHNVLESLSGLVSLYGEHLILLQYLPYAWDLISICRQKRGGKLTPNLEGGLLGCMSLVHHMIPFLSSDSVLMNELSDGLLARVLFPVLQVATSRCLIFTGGWRPRSILIYKLLDVVYLIGLRIGEEMARVHLTPICSALFAAFDKVYDPYGKPLTSELEAEAAGFKGNDINASPSFMLMELSNVLTPELAYDIYVTFYHLVGRAHLDSNLPNLDLIQILCSSFKEIDAIRPITFAHFRLIHSAGLSQESPGSPILMPASTGSRGGNMIAVGSDSSNRSAAQQKMFLSKPDETNYSAVLNSLILKDGSNASRHLKGNWLAYWEHETGRSESEQQFVFKQILLQSFVGHVPGGVVKSLHVLDNENSFLSGGGSKDRTVKVWSIRSKGDGTAAIGPQWTYSLHKKSVTNISFIETLRQAVSCDTSIHIWDPFVGCNVHQVDSTKLGPISVMATKKNDNQLGPVSSCVWIATSNDNMLHTIDCRIGNVISDFKVCVGSVGLVKSVCVMPDGNTVTIGHSTGFISQIDTRTGKLRQSWKGHEGEIITLTPYTKSEFVSTSLDQTVSVWSNPEGKFRCNVAVPPDSGPVNCAGVYGDEIIMGTTSNRIIVKRGVLDDLQGNSENVTAPYIHKLKTDILKSGLTAMKFLPMNKLLLLGQENGLIRLVC